jgi:hypothetical protein
VVVAAVDQRDLEGSILQRPRRVQAGKAPADDNNVGFAGLSPPVRPRALPLSSPA